MVLSPPPNPAVEIAANSAHQVAVNAADLPLVHRLRRLCCTEGLRRMVCGTMFAVDDLIYPADHIALVGGAVPSV